MKLTGRPVNGEDAAINEMRLKIHASLSDPRADIPAEDVFACLRAYRAAKLKKASRADQPKG